MKTNVLSKLKAFFRGKWWLLLVGILGILLILFSGSGTKKAEKVSAADAEAYRKSLCAEIETLCERTAGVGDATVLLTLEMGECAVYEKNLSSSGESVALSGGEALLIGYAYPTVSGVAVVCDGGSSESVRAELTLLLSRALALPSTKIYISGTK